MIEIMNESGGKLLATKIGGKITEKDYQRVTHLVENKIDQYGKINWYFEMEDFKNVSAEAIWEDIKMDIKHRNDYEKIAMVGDQEWEKWLAEMMKPFTSAEVQFYPSNKKAHALDWIRQN